MRQRLFPVARAVLAGALCQALLPPQAFSGQEPAAAPPQFAETVAVQVINIDVHVSDKDGNPVPGLTAADFVLEVDGKRAPISNFYAVENRDGQRLVRRGRAAPVQPAEPEPEAPAAPVAETEIPDDQRLLVVVYVDNFNLSQFNRNRVLKELREFLRTQFGREDRIMLATYDRELHLRHPFTNQPENVNRALLELEDISAQRIHRDRERVDLINMIQDVENDDPEFTIAQVRAYAGSAFNDMRFTIDALVQTVDNLAGSPGRKALVYVSDGVPMIAGEDMYHLAHQLYEGRVSLNDLTEYDLSRRFRELTARANANRVSFYTIDARGLTVSSAATVDLANEPVSAGQSLFIDQVNNSNLQSPLQMMAEETGGRAIINANRIGKDLLRIASELRNYYSLGYMPPETGDGRYHPIEVELRPGLRGYSLSYRRGYRDKSIESRMIDGMLSALHLDLQHNEVELRLLFGPPKPRSDGNFDVPVLLLVPWEKITLVPRGDSYHGTLRVWLAAKDERDRTSEPQSVPLDINIPSARIAEIEGRTWSYKIDLMMERGYHDVAVGWRDELGAQQAFLRNGLTVSGP